MEERGPGRCQIPHRSGIVHFRHIHFGTTWNNHSVSGVLDWHGTSKFPSHSVNFCRGISLTCDTCAVLRRFRKECRTYFIGYSFKAQDLSSNNMMDLPNGGPVTGAGIGNPMQSGDQQTQFEQSGILVYSLYGPEPQSDFLF